MTKPPSKVHSKGSPSKGYQQMPGSDLSPEGRAFFDAHRRGLGLFLEMNGYDPRTWTREQWRTVAGHILQLTPLLEEYCQIAGVQLVKRDRVWITSYIELFGIESL